MSPSIATMIFTGVIAAATVIYTSHSRRQWEAMRQQWEAIRQSNEASSRYLLLSFLQSFYEAAKAAAGSGPNAEATVSKLAGSHLMAWKASLAKDEDLRKEPEWRQPLQSFVELAPKLDLDPGSKVALNYLSHRLGSPLPATAKSQSLWEAAN